MLRRLEFPPPSPFATLADVEAAYPTLKFKVRPRDDGEGFTAFAVRYRESQTSEVLVRAVIVNDKAPKHRHRPGGPYRELIYTIAGVLHDVADDGNPIDLTPGSVLVHTSDDPHQPHATFWVGDYYQPYGSDVVE